MLNIFAMSLILLSIRVPFVTHIYNKNKESNFITFSTCASKDECGAFGPRITVVYNNCGHSLSPEKYGITTFDYTNYNVNMINVGGWMVDISSGSIGCHTNIASPQIEEYIYWLNTKEDISKETVVELACAFKIDSLCSFLEQSVAD